MKKLLRKREHAKNQLLIEIDKTKVDLQTAYTNFENVVDPDLIDSYIYEVNAVQKRYKFLLKQVKLLDA